MKKRHRLTPTERRAIYNKMGGRCAYCGKQLNYEDMQVDHVVALRSNGEDDLANMLPACRSCNHYKRGNSLEGWRQILEAIPATLERDCYTYRQAVRFNMVKPTPKKITFYFEKIGDNMDFSVKLSNGALDKVEDADMDLEEAIQHCYETVKKLRIINPCDACAAEHEQLAHWLEELKKLRAECNGLRSNWYKCAEKVKTLRAERDAAVSDLRKLVPTWKWDGEERQNSREESPKCGCVEFG